ncbi:MAG: hypothetical protein K9M75_09140 [Phycisphaerae bacterium]|nr:hypothetical protein [Phycisphaerae bacterium]
MKSKLKKAIAITCLVSLIVASIAIAEDAQPARRGGPQDGRGRNGAGAPGGNRGSMQPGRPEGMMPPGGPGEMGMGRGRGMSQELIPQSIRQKLNLTEEQNNKLKAAQEEQTKKIQILSKKQQDLKAKLDDAVDKGDKEAVVAIAQETGKAIGESALLKIAEKDILKGILNEEQMKTIEDYNKTRAEMREKMRKQMEERMNSRGERPERGQGQGRGQQPPQSPRRSR